MTIKKLEKKKTTFDDPVITVDLSLSVLGRFPEWCKQVLHPEMHTKRRAFFLPSDLLVLTGLSRKCGDLGIKIYEYLEQQQLLAKCIGIDELEGIRAKGPEFFRQHWKGKQLMGWKSTIITDTNRIVVPSIVCEEGSPEVVIAWDGIRLCHFNGGCLTLLLS
jgi:hypothetical protein